MSTLQTQRKRLKPMRFLAKYGRLILGGSIIGLIIFGSIFAPFLTQYDPEIYHLDIRKQLPSAEHLLGTDNYGRDMFTRILYGGRTTLIVAFGSKALGILLGTVLGLICGYYKWAEKILMRILDAMATIPNLLLCLMMVAIFGAGTVNLIIAMAIGSIPGTARMVRNQVLSLKEKEYIESEHAMGASDARTMFMHILPSCTSYLIVAFSSGLAGAVLSMTSLSYLGLGLSPVIPNWGGMINEAQHLMFGTPHLVLYPGIATCLAVFGFAMLGDGVRDLLDPRLR